MITFGAYYGKVSDISDFLMGVFHGLLARDEDLVSTNANEFDKSEFFM